MNNRKALLSRIYLFSIFFSFFLIPFFVSAQTLPYRQYNVTDGLASSFVTDIVQDRQGFLWVGTQRGLSRFDGLTFKNIFSNKQFPDDYIEDIMVEPGGRMWIGTHGGCIVYDGNNRENRQWMIYTHENGLVNNRVCSIAKAKNGDIWLGTFEGVSLFDGQRFTNFRFGDDVPGNLVKDIEFDQNGDGWFATSRGLHRYSRGIFSSFDTSHGLMDNQVNVLMTDRKGTLWIGTEKGLNRYRGGDRIELCEAVEGFAVISLLEDRNGNLWAGGRNALFFFPAGEVSGENYERYKFDVGRISSIYEDKEGNIWFGSSGGLRKIQFLRIVNFTTVDGLPSNLVWTILEDKRGRIWFGTGKGLTRMWQGEFKTFTTADGLEKDSVYSLAADRNGAIWIGTGGGLSVYSAGTFRTYKKSHGLPDNVVISLMADSRGGVWAGTVKGMCYWNGRVFDMPSFQQSGNAVQCFLETRDGQFWYCDTKSVCRIDSPLDAEKPAVKRYSTNDGVIHSFVNSLFQDSRGRIWMTSQRGLSCFQGGKFSNYTTSDGLTDNACYFVVEDDARNLWIGTARGVCRFNGRSFKSYTVWDGLTSYEMNQGACLKDREGYLWFGTVNGVTRFDPRLDPVNPIPPPVYISHFNVLGGAYPLSTSPGDSIQTRLKYNQNYIQIGFTGISLTSPESLEYRYRLEPIDRGWGKTRERSAGYPYLPPGDYTFKVRAINSDGVDSTQSAKLRFRIMPPFWKTWWFQLLAVFSVLGTGVLFFVWRMKRAREKIELRERNKQLIMSQKMELLGILAAGAIHDLKNLLAVIIAYSKIAARQLRDEESGEKNSPLDRIKTTAVTAVQVVKQILAFTRQSYDKTMSANLPDLVDDIVSILKVTIPEAVAIIWTPPGKEIRFSINPTRFQQVMMNLCLNAVHAMPRGGELTIGLDEAPGEIIFTVRDTGQGMEEDVQARIFEPLFTTKAPGKGTGLGLFVVKQIVEEYRGTIALTSTPGKGTTFTIVFPGGGSQG